MRRLYRCLARANPRFGHDGVATTLSTGRWEAAFRRLTGDLAEVYGLVNLDALSAKRQRTLPACCKVYGLVNFATEMATHHADATAGRLLHGFVGDLISAEYDLEGTQAAPALLPTAVVNDRAAARGWVGGRDEISARLSH